MQNIISFLLAIGTLCSVLQAQTLSKETIIIETNYGTIKVKLFEETPLHKANFLKLVQMETFDSLLFHRVINNFMIQGGDPLSKKAGKNDTLGHGDLGYSVPAEFITADTGTKIFHKKGRLCAAREGDNINPLQASSASQFYIVVGKKRSYDDLRKYEERINKTFYNKCSDEFKKSNEGIVLSQQLKRLKNENKIDSVLLINTVIENEISKLYKMRPPYKFNKTQEEIYLSEGGTPHLDGTYTVFGEVIEGIDVVEKIAQVKTDTRDRPEEDVRIKMRIVD